MRTNRHNTGVLPLILLLTAQTAARAALPAGQLIDAVTCLAAPTQSYALYLPSTYTPARAWPVILAFDPGARGRTPVEIYRAAAETYGFIVAGSNNSRNGLTSVNEAIQAMTADVASRFHLDVTRVYTAGMSGGARVALGLALESRGIAGVIASSAGYPDARPRKTLPFVVFATAGTEDFNHLEMRLLDRELTTPHRLVIFDGGHQWLSSALATVAVEWLEVQAMRAGLEPRNAAEIDVLFAKRLAAAEAGSDPATAYAALTSMADDFRGLKDVSDVERRAEALGREKTVRTALAKARDEDDREFALLSEVNENQQRLASPEDRPAALADLRRAWKDLGKDANAPADSPQRRMARRVIAQLGQTVVTTDPEYLALVAQYRPARGGR